MRKFHTWSVAVLMAASAPALALAQTVGSETQRDVNQQQRIENGLKDGQLSTGEAAKLERGETRIDKMEQNADKNGTVSPAEAARIQRAQNAESQAIKRDTHNARTGNPNSASSERMQNDVQRNINQEKRIKQGVTSGSLTTKETGKLEGQQARIDRKEARTGANGNVSAQEQRRIQRTENRASNKVYQQKHDAQTQ